MVKRHKIGASKLKVLEIVFQHTVSRAAAYGIQGPLKSRWQQSWVDKDLQLNTINLSNNQAP